MNIHKIYILYTGVYCKIGVTSRPVEVRLKEIQTSCPLPIHKYDYLSELSKGDAFHIENELKKHLSDHLIFGEWYKEFDNISRSVYFLLSQINKHNKFITCSTKHKKFYDVSVQMYNKIQNHRRLNDLKQLSKLYTNFKYDKQTFNGLRFIAYSKASIESILENAIGIVINHYRKNEIDISEDISKELFKAKTYTSKCKVRKKNKGISRSTQLLLNRIEREAQNEN